MIELKVTIEPKVGTELWCVDEDKGVIPCRLTFVLAGRGPVHGYNDITVTFADGDENTTRMGLDMERLFIDKKAAERFWRRERKEKA